jgi:hypothetical protein
MPRVPTGPRRRWWPFLAALTVWSVSRVAGLEGFVALSLVWISALTMPHLVLVAWMDVGQSRAGNGDRP